MNSDPLKPLTMQPTTR